MPIVAPGRIGCAVDLKPDAPLTQLFSTTGAPRLTLITCGGQFDAQRLSYLSNVVITAVPS